jgi:hypothetical protein
MGVSGSFGTGEFRDRSFGTRSFGEFRGVSGSFGEFRGVSGSFGTRSLGVSGQELGQEFRGVSGQGVSGSFGTDEITTIGNAPHLAKAKVSWTKFVGRRKWHFGKHENSLTDLWGPSYSPPGMTKRHFRPRNSSPTTQLQTTRLSPSRCGWAVDTTRRLCQPGLPWGLAQANAVEAESLAGADADAARVARLRLTRRFSTCGKMPNPGYPPIKEAGAEYATLLHSVTLFPIVRIS